MRTTLIVVVLLLLSTTSMQAMDPPVIEWERTYFPDNYSRFYDVIETADGGYLVAGFRIQDISSPSDTCMFQFDSSGNLLWAVDPEYYNQSLQKVLHTSAGGYLAVGAVKVLSTSNISLFLLRVEANGNILWTQAYDSSNQNHYGYDLTQLPDGGFAICGETDPVEGMDQAWILRTDSQGDTLWTREWGWEAQDRARGILCIDNVITVLTSGRLEGDPGGTYIIRYSMDGELLSEYWIPELIGRYG